MLKVFYIITICAVNLTVFAQIQHDLLITNESISSSKAIDSTVVVSLKSDAVAEYVIQKAANLQFAGSALQLDYQRSSNYGQHFSYRQLYKSIPIYQSQIKVNIDNFGTIRSVANHSYNLETIYVIEGSIFNINSESISKFFRTKYGVNTTVSNIYPIWLYNENKNNLNYAYHLEIDNLIDGIYLELLIDEDFNIIIENDRQIYYVDTVASGMVFAPDPLTTAMVEYGPPYIDGDDSDIAVLNAQRFEVSFPTNFENDSFVLKNDFMEILDFESPLTPIKKSKTGDFFYTRAESGFEAVNAYYHINNFQAYIWSLGFDNLPDTATYKLKADPHAHGGEDNSSFVATGNTLRLKFGEGGVDDAEDADVIVHEYGHALSYSASPGTNTGFERQALDEGTGDYFAATYSRAYSEYAWQRIFTWDGHNEFFNGRNANTNKHYPEAVDQSIHRSGEIWSSALMDIWEKIGKATTDSLVFAYLFTQFENMSMRDAAILFIQTDSVLTSGRNSQTIQQVFCKRGLIEPIDSLDCEPDSIPDTTLPSFLSTQNINFTNSEKFAVGEGDLYITIPEGTQNAEVQIYNLMDQSINLFKHASDQPIIVESSDLPKGMYLFKVVTNTELEAIEKIVKFR